MNLQLSTRVVGLIVSAAIAWQIGSASAEAPSQRDEASSDEKIWNLLQLGSKYNKIVRPPPDYNSTNVVYMGFVVLKLLGISEVSQHMALEGYTEMEWNDPRLAWYGKFNGSFDNITAIYLPQSAIWIPDIITINTAEYKESNQPLSTIVQGDGRVFTSWPYNSKTLCDINMLYFPFDSQVCRVVFGSWLMVKANLELRLLDKNSSSVLPLDAVRQQRIESDEYCITKSDFSVTSVMDMDASQEAVFTVAIQRKPLFYIMNLIVPSFLILLICVFSFFLPPDSGERLSLNITLMLTLMVFMQIVAGYTPAQSDSVPMLTGFFAAVVALTAVSTVGSVFQLYCCYRARSSHGFAPPAAIRAACFCGLRGRPDKGDEAASGDGNAEATRIQQAAPQDATDINWLVIGRRLDWVLLVAMVIAMVVLAVFMCHARSPDYVAC